MRVAGLAGGSTRNHPRYERMDGVDRAAEVHAEGEVPILIGRLMRGAHEVDAGVTAQNSTCPSSLLDAVLPQKSMRPGLSRSSGTASTRAPVAPVRRPPLLTVSARLSAIATRMPAATKASRDSKADAAGGTGDERDPVVERDPSAVSPRYIGGGGIDYNRRARIFNEPFRCGALKPMARRASGCAQTQNPGTRRRAKSRTPAFSSRRNACSA